MGLEARISDGGCDALEIGVEVGDTLVVEDVVLWTEEVVGRVALAACCASEPDWRLFNGRDGCVDSGGPSNRRCRLEKASQSFFGFLSELSEHFICIMVLAIMNKPPTASTSATPSVLNVL